MGLRVSDTGGPRYRADRGYRRLLGATILALVVLLLQVSTASAGRLVETGEVADVSCDFNPALGACQFLRAALDYVRTGSPDPSKPILLFDEPPNHMLHAIVAAYGGSPPFSIDEHKPSTIDFNSFTITPAQFSAVVVASDYTCGTGSACGDLNPNSYGQITASPTNPCYANDPFPAPEVPPGLTCFTEDSDALIAPPGHNAINNFYNAGGGILVGSGADNGDGHGGDLYYDFVNAPRGLLFSGDPSSLTALGLAIGFTPSDIGHTGCPTAPSSTASVFQTCPYNAFFPLPTGSSLRVAETDQAGDPVTLFQDTNPPITTITSAPAPLVVTRGPTAATFTFSASENLVTFECRLDSGPFSPCSSPATYQGLGEGDHVFSVRSIDAAGNVEAAPPAASWLVAFDLDGDGFTRFSNPPDCNDNNPHIYPGAPEPPGGHVDSDCEGVIDPFPIIRPHVSFYENASRRSTQFTRLVVTAVPVGSTVDITCTGRRHCPFRHTSVAVKRANRPVSFTRLLRGLKLPVGLVVAIRATRPQSIGGYVSLTIRRLALPLEQSKCMNPGQRTPRSVCPRYT